MTSTNSHGSIPRPLSLAVGTVSGGVVQPMAFRAPIFCTHRLAREALGRDAWVYFCPRLSWVASCLLSEVLVIDNPARPSVLLASFGDNCLIGHQVRNSFRSFRGQRCHVRRKALQPGCQVGYDLATLHQVCRLDNNHLTLKWWWYWSSSSFCWWEFCKINLVPCQDLSYQSLRHGWQTCSHGY